MNNHSKYLSIARCGLAALCALFAQSAVLAAGQTIRLENDSNSRLEIKDAIVDGDRTTVLFWTWPDRGDPNFRDDCGKNYYTVTLHPGLPAAEPRLLAKGACAGTGQLHGGLLGDGSGKFIVQDRLEHWSEGERISSRPLATLGGVGTLNMKSSEMGAQLVDVSPSGDLVMAVAVSGSAASEWNDAAAVVASLAPDNEKRWLVRVGNDGSLFSPERLWAGDDGSALLHYFTIDTTRMLADQDNRLMHVDAGGRRTDIPLVEIAQPFDMLSIQPGSEEDLQKALAYADENRSEKIESLAARASRDGGFDVLFERESTNQKRNEYVLLRLDRNGSVTDEKALGSVIGDHGLERWFDFYVDGNELVLLSSALATQHGVNSRRKKWSQTVVSWIEFGTGKVRSRLIPLERQYLEAAMNAGDAGQQYLEGQPGGTPVLLTSLGGSPLALSQGWVKKRGTLRIYEATDDLVAFTEAYDEQQARLAKETQRVERKAARESSRQQMNDDMAAAMGMSSEEFDALSEEEQAAAMMQGGDMQAVMAAAMKQVQAAQAGLTPEQAAQLEQQMAQVQQMMQGGGSVPPSHPAGAAAAAPPAEATSSFTVDALNRARIQYRGAKSTAVSLQLINRKDDAELMQKDYPGGEIDEYISLGRYDLPPEQIGAIIRKADGTVLAELALESP